MEHLELYGPWFKCKFCSLFTGPGCFKDKLSEQEWRISGLCQKCQDEIFSCETFSH